MIANHGDDTAGQRRVNGTCSYLSADAQKDGRLLGQLEDFKRK
jgi:hypothetical protein